MSPPALTLRLLFHLPLRQAKGFLTSLFVLMGLDLRSPDHTTLSRRGQHLNLTLRAVPSRAGLHLIIDSTGLSIAGEGEWAAAKHGGRGTRGWKKLHVGVEWRRQCKDLCHRTTEFFEECSVDTNATQAAIRAGYSPRSARSVGHEDLTGPDIRAAIDGAQSKQFEAAGVSASRTLQALTQIAFLDITAVFDDDGHLRPYGELTPAQRAQISTISRRRRKKEGGGTEVTYAIRLWDKVRALELLMKGLGLLNQHVAVDDREIVARLRAGRRRAMQAKGLWRTRPAQAA